LQVLQAETLHPLEQDIGHLVVAVLETQTLELVEEEVDKIQQEQFLHLLVMEDQILEVVHRKVAAQADLEQ
jgi:ribosome biogenesis protein Nip4